MKVNDVFTCYQCGMCTGDCPVAWANPEFNPRKIILNIQSDGSSELVWLCSVCFKCLRCPRDVKPVEVFSNLRKLAVANDVDNVGTRFVKAFVDVVKEHGRFVETKFMMKFVGLNSLKIYPPSVLFKMLKAGKITFSAKRAECIEEVKKIFEVCGRA